MKYIVLIEEDGDLFPVLDHAANPIGDRFPIKVFATAGKAIEFQEANGLEDYLSAIIELCN